MVRLLKIKKMNYKIIGQYIKNLKFNIPNSKAFFLLSKDISNYKINIDIKSKQIKEKIIEIDTSINLSPIKSNFEIIDTKIIYSTVIEISEKCTDKLEIEKIILIDVPSKVYPNLRKTFIYIFENSGFKNVNIKKEVDFKELYNKRKFQ